MSKKPTRFVDQLIDSPYPNIDRTEEYRQAAIEIRTATKADDSDGVVAALLKNYHVILAALDAGANRFPKIVGAQSSEK